MSDENAVKEKTVVFLCKCSSNISSAVDFKKIKAWVKKTKKADLIVEANLLCSPKEKDLMRKLLKGKNKFMNKGEKIKNIVSSFVISFLPLRNANMKITKVIRVADSAIHEPTPAPPLTCKA